MRIVGGKDYYDSASAYGIDPTIVFVRDSRLLTKGDMSRLHGAGGASLTFKDEDGVRFVPGEHSYWYNTSKLTRSGRVCTGSLHGVVFCGKAYQGLTIEERDERTGLLVQSTHIWHANAARKWAERFGMTAYASYTGRRENHTLEDCFTVHTLEEKYVSAMVEMGISIMVKRAEPEHVNYAPLTKAWNETDSGWRADCDGLKDIGFQSALDPVTAFQELSMWVGGTLSSRAPKTVEITDDKIKIAKHGMDHTSFRRPKQVKTK